MRTAHIVALRFVLAGIAIPVPCLRAQSAGDIVAIETAAAKAALARQPWRVENGKGPKVTLTLSPALQHGQDRPQERTAALAERLGAKVGRYEDLFRCDSGPAGCPPSSVPAIIAVTEPIVEADSARVTVYTRYLNSKEEGYETVEFLLVRRSGSWAIARATQIGIS